MFLLWLRVTAVLYGVASLLALPAVLYGQPRWQRVGIPLALAGFFTHLVATVEILVAAHRWMPMGMHEIESALSLLIVAAYLLVYAGYRAPAFGIFALPMAFLLLLEPALGPDRRSFVTPDMRSWWLYLHVGALLAAYAALIFSLLAGFLYLVQERRLKQKAGVGFLTWLPPLETMDRIAYLSLLVGFPCMTLGLFAGSLIAQQSVGPAYFLDPKVLLSFGMWLIYVAMLLVRRSTGFRGRRAMYLSSFVFLVMLSVWAANQLSSVHRYPVP
jgi:ABC-type uncharacterized transport system permease subunit